MPHFRYVMVWPATSLPDQSWSEDDDPEEDAFARTTRNVTELYSQGLATLGLHGRCSELQFFVGRRPEAAGVEVSVFTEHPESFEAARAELPTGWRPCPLGNGSG